MSANQERNWKDTAIVVLVALVAYLIWDSYYNDPLTRIAQAIDASLDEAAGGTRRVAGAVVDETGRLVTGGRNLIGTALVGTGELVRYDDDDMEDIA